MKPRKRLFFYLIENDIEDFYYKNPAEKEFVRADEKGAGKWNYWEGKEYSYFSHKNCEFFPCHKGADPEDFNCLFCYCPLYALGDKCGGNFHYNEKGFKDCTNCQLPHKRKNYGYVTGKYQELADLMKKVRENQDVKEK